MVAARLIKFFKKYFDGIVLFLYPLFLILLNSNWIFTPAILSPDPWFYFAFFRYFDKYAPAFPSNTHYFVERLTWNVPGFYLYKIFSPELANYVLHLLVYYAAVFSLYGIIKLLFTRRTAFVSAILMGSYPWFLRAVGWDYVDGVGIAHLLFLFFLLALSVRAQHWKLILFVGGMVHASLLITNQFWLGFAPAWIAFFLLLSFKNKNFSFNRLLQAGILFIIGNLILTIVVSIYYHGVTGEYNFLKNSIAFSQRISSDEQNVREVIKFYGQMPPYWHILPMLFSLLGIRQLFIKQKGEHHYELLTILVAYGFSYLWLIYWHIYKIPYLSVYLYSSYIIPATFLLIGALIYPVIERLSEQQFQRLILPMLFLMAAPLFLCTIIPSIRSLQRNVWIFAGITIGVFFAFTMLHKKAVLLIFLTGISLMYYQSGASFDIGVYTPDRSLNRNNFNTLIDASREIDTYYPDHKYLDFRLWFRADENMITKIPLASIYLYPWGSSINMYFSDHFEWPENVQLMDGNIVLITANPDSKQVIDEANNALMPYNAELNFESSRRIAHGNLDITLTFTNLEVKPMKFDFGKKYEFDYQPINWQNWQLPENDGRSFMWSGPGSKSDLRLVLPSSDSDIRVQFCVISSLKPSTLASLKLMVNETPIPITLTKSSDCPYLYSGIIQFNIISANPLLTLASFQVDETVSPKELNMSSDERKLGLAFDWIIFERVK